ncbi:hypothetical protein HUC09_18740, partial [Escherichia coli]|nr:hypothetical protein [Escherichia coli]
MLRCPRGEWRDAELKRVDELADALGLDDMGLFAYGAMIVKRRAYVAGSLSRA